MSQPAFKLILFTYGEPEFQQDFWQRAIVDTGLAPYSEHGAQINAIHAAPDKGNRLNAQD
ncbi:MAG: hypothetical protein CMJ35_03740 [Phycisphaerae bacterium]|nr:hypothetical protein [Phycisphaerae bacterium]MBM90711.1 hypothetical protein [Phycisphaerae bacterium]HCT46589.1 hypothetical protein [Phycisphaerales bacterium]|tara:strand:+ start:859 stop:1038 length:180 start_codon:yes stop_codon:yes gene_type:complete